MSVKVLLKKVNTISLWETLEYSVIDMLAGGPSADRVRLHGRGAGDAGRSAGCGGSRDCRWRNPHRADTPTGLAQV